MEPFYNHTLTVSNQRPSLPQYIGVIWGLEDLCNDILERQNDFTDISDQQRGAFVAAKSKLKKIHVADQRSGYLLCCPCFESFNCTNSSLLRSSMVMKLGILKIGCWIILKRGMSLPFNNIHAAVMLF